ncbi:MAG: MGMT family protein [Desulfurococcaceae archaeon]
MLVVRVERGRVVAEKASLSEICQAVYTLTQLIPQGFVSSYSSIGRALGVHPRVVAHCLSENKEIIIIPCHRVVYNNMRIGGYRELGAGFKKKLLVLEGVEISDNTVSRKHFVDLSELIHSSPHEKKSTTRFIPISTNS